MRAQLKVDIFSLGVRLKRERQSSPPLLLLLFDDRRRKDGMRANGLLSNAAAVAAVSAEGNCN